MANIIFGIECFDISHCITSEVKTGENEGSAKFKTSIIGNDGRGYEAILKNGANRLPNNQQISTVDTLYQSISNQPDQHKPPLTSTEAKAIEEYDDGSWCEPVLRQDKAK